MLERVTRRRAAEREVSRSYSSRLGSGEGLNETESEPTVTLEGARPQSEEAPTAGHGNGRSGTSRLMEEVVERDNLKAALKRVRHNKGSPGIDGMTVDELVGHLRTHWPRIREEVLAGTYQPLPVKRQEIPKNGGGVRLLGIPTVPPYCVIVQQRL